MTTESLVSVRKSVLLGAGVALLAIGAGVGYGAFAAAHDPSRPTAIESTVPARSAAGGGGHAPSTAVAIAVPMSPEARTRAGIVLAKVSRGDAGTTLLRAPGVVEPNAYKRV